MSFSDEEGKQILDAFRALGVKPKASSPEELQNWMVEHFSVKGSYAEAAEHEAGSMAGGAELPEVRGVGTLMANQQWPRLPTFSGDNDSKSDATFDLWKFEVTCLLKGKLHSEEVIRQVIRRSLRGQAARITMHLGPMADSTAILAKLEGTYGPVEVGQALLSEFYASFQEKDEDVVSWGCRLEAMMDKAKQQGLVEEDKAKEILQVQFWTNLNQRLKDSSRHKYEHVIDFDKLLQEIRSIEREHKVADARDKQENSTSQTTQSHRTATTFGGKREDSDGKGVKDLTGIVNKLTNQLENLQQQLQAIGQAQQHQAYMVDNLAGMQQQQQTQRAPPPQKPSKVPDPRGPQSYRPPSGGQDFGPTAAGQGRPYQAYGYGGDPIGQASSSRSQSLIGNGCYKCGLVGHQKWQCPLRNEGVVCYLCHQPGHVRRECPYLALNRNKPLS